MINCCKTTGFVFKKEDNSEADKVFFIFTEELGRIKIFGRAIRKINSKLKSGIDIFSIAEIEFIQGKSKKTLTDAIFIKNFTNVKSSPKRFEIANKISRTIDDFVKQQEKDSQILKLLKTSFEKLNDNNLEKKNCDLIYYYFLWNFFSILGFKPEVQKCASCFSNLDPKNIYFSCMEGGVICENCCKNNKDVKIIDSDVIKILRLILKNEWSTIAKLKINCNCLKSLENISTEYYFSLLEK